MFTKLTPVIAIALLSGCTLTNSEQYHQETLAAIQSSETNLTQKFTRLESQVSDQAEHIESLQSKVDMLDKELMKFKYEAMAEVKKKREPVLVPTQVQVQAAPTQEVVLGEIEKVTIDSSSKLLTLASIPVQPRLHSMPSTSKNSNVTARIGFAFTYQTVKPR